MAHRRRLWRGMGPIAAMVTVVAVAGCSAFWFGVDSGDPSPTTLNPDIGIVDLGWAYGVQNDSDTELLVRLSYEMTTVVPAGVSGPLGSDLGSDTPPIVILDSRCFEIARLEPSTQIGRLVIDADRVRLEDLIDDPEWTDLLAEPMPYTDRCTPPIRWGPLETPGPTLRVVRP